MSSILLKNIGSQRIAKNFSSSERRGDVPDFDRKSEKQIEADIAVQDWSVGAVAGKDDDDEEVSSGPLVIMSKPATATRARDNSSILKIVSATYSRKIGHIATTFGAWKVFRDSLGTDVLQQYRGTFEEGKIGLF